jgi:DICT domain-containing protein/predicted DNA-binding transcriptional regulator AlpA
MPTAPTLTIRQIADQSGINEATLRMWESRHGFPHPERLASGHRRYSERDLDAVRSVVRARAEGLSLASAIERARRLEEEPDPSVFGALRERFPQLQPFVLPKRVLIRLSHALEDECCLRARRPVLFASFQHERFYRAAEERWREISRTADTAIVFADFAKLRRPRGAPVEVPLAATDELMREWVIVCDAPDIAACLVAWERPRGRGQPRRFEAIWTVERDVVRHAARACADLAARVDPDLAAGVRERLAGPAVEGDGEVRHAVALATRMVFYALEGER